MDAITWTFFLGGVTFAVLPVIRIIYTRCCTEVVDGWFMDVIIIGIGSRSIKRAKFYYEYDGKEYIGFTNIGVSTKQMRDFAKGVRYKIFVNPKNPKRFVFDKKPTFAAEILPLAIGCLFILIGFTHELLFELLLLF